MLEIKSASLYYADELIFEKLSFHLPQGQWLALLGASGVGKTTLLRLIAGLHQKRPQAKTQVSGEVLWQGSRHFKVAYMAQQDGLVPWRTVLDNVLLPFDLEGLVRPYEQAKDLLKQVGLDSVMHFYPDSLSGGMRQRVALVRTLLQDAPLILMDEPFSALDAMTRLEMQDLAYQLLREAGKTVVMVTHDPQEALRLADEVQVLSGRPVEIQPFTENLRSPPWERERVRGAQFLSSSAPAPRPKRRERIQRVWRTAEVLVLLAVLCLGWMGIKAYFHVPDYFLPWPAAVFTSLLQNHALLGIAFYNTFTEAILGFILAALLALLLGFVAYVWALFARMIHPLVVISQAVPMLVLAPLIVLWLGFGWSAKLTIIVLALFFPILASFMAGLEQVKPLFLDLAATMNAGSLRLFRFVVFPASLPYLAAGLRVAITWAILAAMIAEWVGGSNGLGFVMQNALSRLDVALLFAALLILLVSTLILYALMSAVLSCLVFWKD